MPIVSTCSSSAETRCSNCAVRARSCAGLIWSRSGAEVLQLILPDQLEHDDRLIEQLRCRMGHCTDQRMEMAFPGPTLWQSKPSIKACSCTALSSTDDIQMMLFTAEGLLRAYVPTCVTVRGGSVMYPASFITLCCVGMSRRVVSQG